MRTKKLMGRRGRELWVLMGDDEIKKGPWTAEEDEVLINHVSQFGPRDWSSIRSKGLLHRTGKSCRLRWVNKLRPNLKTGVKFSAEEERVVIELQAQLGNKWAQIASNLAGRTDNDVKNFWSSRQKKLARFLKTSPASSSKTDINKEISNVQMDMEAPKVSSSTEEEVSPNCQSFSSSSSSSLNNFDMFKMVPARDLLDPNLLSPEPNLLQFEFKPGEKLGNNICEQLQKDLFPKTEDDEVPPLSFGNGVTNFLDLFGDDEDVSDLGNISQEVPFYGPQGNGGNTVGPDSFFEDFPPDLFGPMASLSSPSKW